MGYKMKCFYKYLLFSLLFLYFINICVIFESTTDYLLQKISVKGIFVSIFSHLI